MPSMSSIAYVVLGLLIVRPFLQPRYQVPTLRLAVAVTGLSVFADTGSIPWPATLGLWLGLVGLLLWRESRDRRLAASA